MNDTQATVNELNALVATFNADFNEFILKGNYAASTRARKSLGEIRKMITPLRKQITEDRAANKANRAKA